ncbi:MAG: hypothetical protein L0J54_09995 [Halomonas sp.]|nr:hypothetical protein [Halomonas sp.]MDN6298336.1 hypothetical protein [Halomonas sp.]MDN6315735.1 hypothetical protein [Halomonas sp.]MDN6337175.1 hypothetical protein [Halomonas sp.]
MTERTQARQNRHSESLAHLATLDLSSDDIVRPELCNAAILAGNNRCAEHTNPQRNRQ